MTTEYRCSLPDILDPEKTCNHLYSRTQPPAEPTIALHLGVTHGGSAVRLVEISPLDEWMEEPVTKRAIRAAQDAWDSEAGNDHDEDAYIGIGNALVEFIIALDGLPPELDSLAVRQRLYRAIIEFDSVGEWMEANR